MITWRGWGLVVLPIGIVPFLYSVIATLEMQPETAGQEPLVSGPAAVALLVSAALNLGLDRLLRGRHRSPHQDEFMGIRVRNWTAVFLVIAAGLAVARAARLF